MALTRKPSKLLWILWAFLAVIVLSVLAFFLYPESLSKNEGRRIHDQIAPYDVAIIFNPGGWGNATLEEAQDFTPILRGIQQTLSGLGFSSTVIAYTRTPSGLGGRISDIKELTNSFIYSSQVQARDLKYLIDSFPQKQFILAGFSNGGGLTGKTAENLLNQPRFYAISAGVPCWYQTYSSTGSLVLNNNGKDSLAMCDKGAMIVTIIKAPFKWIWAKITGQDLNIALAFEFPGHDYTWSSSEVGPPIVNFLENNLKANIKP